MKKTMIVFSASLMLTALSSNLQAQDNGTYASNVNPVYSYFHTNEDSRELASSEVNSVALKDFTKKNKTVSNVSWTANGNVLSVYYTKNNVKMRSTYNEKGKWEYTLRYFNAANAPKSIRNLVASNYDMNIVQVTEVERKGVKYHLVKMEDAKSFVTVQVMNGEIDLYEKLDK
jgi:hypothetical protein